MVFNKGQNRYVYSKLVTFQTGIRKGEYQTKIRIPKGESELYAFYAPNRTGWAYGGAPKDVPYYTPEGVLKNNIPWDFSEKEEEDVSMEDIQGSALPAIIDLKMVHHGMKNRYQHFQKTTHTTGNILPRLMKKS